MKTKLLFVLASIADMIKNKVLLLLAVAVALLVCSFVYASTFNKKIEVTNPSSNIWSVAVTKDSYNGTTNDSIDVIRIIDNEQMVTCYLMITTSYQPEIYCLRTH